MLAVEGQGIEGVQLHFVILLSGMQRLEIGDAVDAEHLTKCFCRFFSAPSFMAGRAYNRASAGSTW
jgi:hypothetical protein